jgi:hypothetical protein
VATKTEIREDWADIAVKLEVFVLGGCLGGGRNAQRGQNAKGIDNEGSEVLEEVGSERFLEAHGEETLGG